MVSVNRHVVLSDRIEIERLLAEVVPLAGGWPAGGVFIGQQFFRGGCVNGFMPNLRPYLLRTLDTRPSSQAAYFSERAEGHAVAARARSHAPYRMAYHRLDNRVIGRLRQG